MKILAIPATNSDNGINRQLLGHVAKLLEADGAQVEFVDINDYEMPIYSPAREAAGIPELATEFFEKMGAADAIVFSFAEHNGSYSTAFKNILDWTTRIDMAVYQGKKVAMLAATPGSMAGASVLGTATTSAAYFGAELVGSLGVGEFYDNFDGALGEVINPELLAELTTILGALTA